MKLMFANARENPKLLRSHEPTQNDFLAIISCPVPREFVWGSVRYLLRMDRLVLHLRR